MREPAEKPDAAKAPLDQAWDLLRSAIFTFHPSTGQQSGRYVYGNGFFICCEDGEVVGLTADHLLRRHTPNNLFNACYQNNDVTLRWRKALSSKRTDVATVQLDSPPKLNVRALPVAYFDPWCTPTQYDGFWAGRRLCLLGNLSEGDSLVECQIVGAVPLEDRRSSAPSVNPHREEQEEGDSIYRLVLEPEPNGIVVTKGDGTREALGVERLRGMSGAPVLDLQLRCVVGVLGSFDPDAPPCGDVRWTELGRLVDDRPKVIRYFRPQTQIKMSKPGSQAQEGVRITGTSHQGYSLFSSKSPPENYSKIFKGYADAHPSEVPLPDVDWIDANHPVDPADQDLVDSPAYLLCPCTVVIDSNKNDCVAILPSSSSAPQVEAQGRTATLLELLGISIPYTRLMELDESQLPEQISLYRYLPSGWQVVACDMAYIGVEKNELKVAPTGAERFWFAWDLARHIIRSTSLQHNPGDHRSTQGRRKLAALFNKISLARTNNALRALPQGGLRINRLVLLRHQPGISADPPTIASLTRLDDERRKLRDAFSIARHLRSPFWFENPSLTPSFVNNLLASKTNLPDMQEVLIVRDSVRPPTRHVYREVARLIKSGPARAPQEDSFLYYHNKRLLSSLGSVNTIDLLAVSGDSVISDAAFWKALGERNDPLSLTILLLDPELARDLKLRSSAGEPMHLELEESIKALRRLQTYLQSRGSGVSVSVKLYKREPPPFKLTFFGNNALRAPYIIRSGRIDVGKTDFRLVRRDQDEHDFDAHRRIYEDFERGSKPVSVGEGQRQDISTTAGNREGN